MEGGDGADAARASVVVEPFAARAHARDLKPEPDELPKIQAKIDNGLPDDPAPNAAAADKKKDDDGKGG